MRKIIAILLLTGTACLGQTTDVRITADGTIINTQTVKFATGKLMVNGVAVVGGPAGVSSVSGTAPIVSSGGLTPAISITAATTGAPGSMSAADKTKLDGIAAGAQPGTVTSVAVSGANGIGVSGSPITTSGTFALSLGAITPTSVAASGAVSGSNLSGTNTGDQYQGVTSSGALQYLRRDISNFDYEFGTLPDAAANGATKGVSTFTAADFNATTGNISLDYTNGQAASGSAKGFLTSADWTTFNGKVGTETDPLALKIASNLSDLNNASTARTNLGVAVGTNVQAWDADLDTWAGITPATKANLSSPTFTGTVTIPTPFTLGAVSVLPTGTELNFVDGVTSAIQTQLDAKGPAPSDTAYDEATWNGVTTIAPSKNSARDKFVLVDAVIQGINDFLGTLPQFSRPLFDETTGTATTSTDGSQDVLLDYLISTGTLDNQGSKIQASMTVVAISSATAARRIRLFLTTPGGDQLIWDSGSLTLSLGGSFFIRCDIYERTASDAKCTVFVGTTSASTVPYVTYTSITDADWQGSTQSLKLTGAASGAGAAAGDILLRTATISKVPAGATVQ